MPGRCGDSIRAFGYLIFTLVVRACDLVSCIFKHAQDQLAGLEQACLQVDLERRRWLASISAGRGSNTDAAVA